MERVLILLALIGITGNLSAQELNPIALNQPSKDRALSLMQAFEKRASMTKYTSTKLSLQDISDLLWAANGVNRPDVGKRTAASAMNSQDIDIYVFMEEGVYLYDAFKNVLTPVIKGDNRILVAGRQAEVAKAPVILLLVSDISRFKRGEEKQKMIWAAEDAGIVSQNISIFCAGAGLGTRIRASMDEAKLKEVLKLKDTQYPMLNNPVCNPE